MQGTNEKSFIARWSLALRIARVPKRKCPVADAISERPMRQNFRKSAYVLIKKEGNSLDFVMVRIKRHNLVYGVLVGVRHLAPNTTVCWNKHATILIYKTSYSSRRREKKQVVLPQWHSILTKVTVSFWKRTKLISWRRESFNLHWLTTLCKFHSPLYGLICHELYST